MNDLLSEHQAALQLFELGKILGLQKQAKSLPFEGLLYLSRSGCIVLDIPSAVLRGCFSAIGESGAELATTDGRWEPSIEIMTRAEVEQIGGAKRVTERGHSFDYDIIGATTASPDASSFSKTWALEVNCPELEKVRQSYGLPAKPPRGFLAEFARLRKNIFRDGGKVQKEWTGGALSVVPVMETTQIVWKKLASLMPGVHLQPHQQALEDEVDKYGPVRKLLLWQTGSGKSLGALAAAERFGQPYTVVGPAAVRPSFQQEQKRFTDMTTPSKVISYQQAVNAGALPYPESVVIDEAQRLVNPGARQTQTLNDATQQAKQLLLLSGTPIINRPGDLAPLASMLTERNITPAAFEARYLGHQRGPRGWLQWFRGIQPSSVPTIQNRRELQSLLEGHVDYYEPEHPMVPVQHTVHESIMSPVQSKLYRAMFGKIPWKLRLGLDGSTDLSPRELRQLTAFLAGPRQVGLSTLPFASHGDPYRSFQESPKLQQAFGNMNSRLVDDPRTKGIVYSNFPTAGLYPYAAALRKANIPHVVFDGSLNDEERRRAVDLFNRGKARIALVGPAGAEGISLRGAQLIQQLDPHWNEARMRQSAARGIRFDSHTGLPEELQNVEVQRYVSKMPPNERSFLQMLRLMPYSEEPQEAADDKLRGISERKEMANKLFLDLLKQVGSHKRSSELIKEAQQQPASITISSSCPDCSAHVSKHYAALGGEDDASCPNCGRKVYIPFTQEHCQKMVDEACSHTDTSPSQEQIEAGNYKKGRFIFHGMTVVIENPKGSIRRGVSKSGHRWEKKMEDPYGYFVRAPRSEADGDHVDVFVGPDLTDSHVYVIDQDVDGKFDEHKCVIGVRSAQEADELYHRNYTKDWKGFSGITCLNLNAFKEWLYHGDTSIPLRVEVPKDDVMRVRGAVKDLDNDGGYGNVYLNKRRHIVHLETGDWWEQDLIDKYKKALHNALPGYDFKSDAESSPSGYCDHPLSDWMKIKYRSDGRKG